jgi:hypothetical protein
LFILNLTEDQNPVSIRLDNSDLIESIDWVTMSLAEALTLVELIRDQSAKDGHGPIHHHRIEQPARASRQRRLDSDLVITVAPEGRTICFRPALATGLRLADYEVLIEHPSTVYPYGLANMVSEYMVCFPHLFVDPAERDHVSNLSLLELPEIGHPAPIINMVNIRQIGGDLLSTIREESTRSTGSTHAITNPYEEEFPAFPLALEAQSSPSAPTNHLAKGRRTKRELLRLATMLCCGLWSVRLSE